MYYYSNNWSRKGRIPAQVLEERDSNDTLRQWFAYGNYIDEVLFKNTASTGTGSCHMYLQDHLYSTVALLDADGAAVERYEYDAYGNPYIFTSNDGVWFNGNDEYWDYSVNYGNPYLFTGREFDCLDEGNLRIQYNRNRYYDYYTGRWLSHDRADYRDGLNLYEYVKNNPCNRIDPNGFLSVGILPIIHPLLIGDPQGGYCPTIFECQDEHRLQTSRNWMNLARCGADCMSCPFIGAIVCHIVCAPIILPGTPWGYKACVVVCDAPFGLVGLYCYAQCKKQQNIYNSSSLYALRRCMKRAESCNFGFPK